MVVGAAGWRTVGVVVGVIVQVMKVCSLTSSRPSDEDQDQCVCLNPLNKAAVVSALEVNKGQFMMSADQLMAAGGFTQR